jgi:hypothetical protein
MRARTWAAVGVAVVAVTWAGMGYLSTKPTDFHTYRVAAVGAAQSAYGGLATAQITSRALADGEVTGPYATSVLDDAREALAGAVKRLAAESPPDPPTTAMRDELGPLLLDTDRALSTMEDAATAVEQRAAADGATATADALRRFIVDHT